MPYLKSLSEYEYDIGKQKERLNIDEIKEDLYEESKKNEIFNDFEGSNKGFFKINQMIVSIPWYQKMENSRPLLIRINLIV